MTLRIALTTGEPAGIGPDLTAAIAARGWPAEIVAIGDPQLLATRAAALGRPLTLEPCRRGIPPQPAPAGTLRVAAVPLRVPARAGQLDRANAAYVIETLQQATAGCLDGEFDAVVTAPVHKGIINDAGIAFSGHTEFIAGLTGAACPVMMLVAGGLRVALVTTHLPLREVPAQVTRVRLEAVLDVLQAGLTGQFGIAEPRIAVLGLNPHAGDEGLLGKEENEVIKPVITDLKSKGKLIFGPFPADGFFGSGQHDKYDGILAMYHDQGLIPFKYIDFQTGVNFTAGLPTVRTSPDHGTAYNIAGKNLADESSLRRALFLAADIIKRRQPQLVA